MDHLRTQCIALYDLAFPGEPADCTAALFDRYFPDHVRVIEQDGTVASMLFSIPYPILFENGMQNAHYLYAIATHPDHRRRGLGRLVLAALLEQARARGLVEVTLEVRESNLPAIALYSGFGFEQVGYRPRFYSHPVEAALIMRCQLREV